MRLADFFQRVASIAMAKAPDVGLAIAERLFTSAIVELDARTRERGRAALPTLQKAARTSDWAKFPRAPGRLPFLSATRSFLRRKELEWVVVGIGTWKGNRSVIREAFVREGTKHSASIPVSVQASIRGHIDENERAEVLHLHNHAAGLLRDLKNLLVGIDPVPSDADREALLAHAEAAVRANEDGGVRRTRFYLVENDQVHEYTLPPWRNVRPHLEAVLAELSRA